MTFTVTLCAGQRARGQGRAGRPADGTAIGGCRLHGGRRRRSPSPRARPPRPIDVAIRGDALNEENETLKVNLSNPVGIPAGKPARRAGRRDDRRQERTAVPLDQRHDRRARARVRLRGHAGGHDAADGDRATSTRPTERRRPAPTTPPASAPSRSRPGEKTKTITVTVLDDAVAEADRGVLRSVIGDPVNATITKSRGEASIEASDQPATPRRRRATAPTGTSPTGTPTAPANRADERNSCRG